MDNLVVGKYEIKCEHDILIISVVFFFIHLPTCNLMILKWKFFELAHGVVKKNRSDRLLRVALPPGLEYR